MADNSAIINIGICKGRTFSGTINIEKQFNKTDPECRDCSRHFSQEHNTLNIVAVMDPPEFNNGLCPSHQKL